MLDAIVPLEGSAVTVRFLGAARRYWVGVFPAVCDELAGWRRRADAIPDPTLRRLALQAQAKRANMEGAAVFAAYAPRRHRAAAVRAAVAFQSAYNYLDLLCEQPSDEAIANGRSLHAALRDALRPETAQHADYYAHSPAHEDGGYLQALVECARRSLRSLPSWEAVAGPARVAADRVIAFQSLNLGRANGDHRLLALWGAQATPEGSGLRWWETACAGGSSLGVHVLIAAATEQRLSASRVQALERAYFPWIGALHSLLDTLVDLDEDARTGQRSLISYYSSAREAAERVRWLMQRSRTLAEQLPDGERHVMFLAAMTGMYLSRPESSHPQVRIVREETLDAVGRLAGPTLLVFALRRRFGAVKILARGRGREGRRPDWAQRRAVSAMACSAEVQEPWGDVRTSPERLDASGVGGAAAG